MTRTATGSATLFCVPWHKCLPPDVLLPLAHWVRIGKGGEAFCVFLTDVDAEKTRKFADSLRAGVELLRFDAYPELRVTVRLAVVTIPIHERDERQRQRCLEYLASKAHEAAYCLPKDKKYDEVVCITHGD
jgi:hypothetical protein